MIAKSKKNIAYLQTKILVSCLVDQMESFTGKGE